MPSHHRMLPDDYDDKPKQSHRSRSPNRNPRERPEHSEPRKSASKLTFHSISSLLCILCIDAFPLDHHILLFFLFSAALKEEKPESKDLLADLQDISDSERKTSTGESSIGDLQQTVNYNVSHQ